MSPAEDTFRKLRRAIAGHLGIPEADILPHTRLRHLFGSSLPADQDKVDSLDRIELSMAFEEWLEIDFDPTEGDLDLLIRLMREGTVGDLAQFLDGKRRS